MGFFEGKQRQHLESAYPNVTDSNERTIYLRACVINAIEQECVRVFMDHEEEILSGTFQGSLIEHMESPLREAFNKCVSTAKQYIYKDRQVLDVELAGYKIIYELLDLFMTAVLNPDKSYSQLLINRVPGQYEVRHSAVTERIRGVLDYISGMTDVYALDLYRKINGQSLPMI